MGMKAIIPSYQLFFSPESWNVGSVSCHVVLLCLLSGASVTSDDAGFWQDDKKTVAIIDIESARLDGELAVLQSGKLTVVVKLPCGCATNPFLSGQRWRFEGRLEFWAKPEIELDKDYQIPVEILEISEENVDGDKAAIAMTPTDLAKQS
jgi:hypothetical protein